MTQSGQMQSALTNSILILAHGNQFSYPHSLWVTYGATLYEFLLKGEDIR